MSKSTHVLKIQNGSKVYTCDLYTTMAEARKELYPNQPLFRVKIGNETLYAPFTSTLDSATESTPLVCPLFAGQGDNTLYCVAQHAFYKVNITPVANAKFTVIAYENIGNVLYEITRWNSGAKWLPFGTELDIAVSGDPDDIWMSPGLVITPNTEVWLVNKNKEITATAPTRWTYEFLLAGTTHQTVTVKYTQPGKSETTKTSTSSAQYISVLAGTTWSATVAGATGYNPGSLQYGSSGTIRDNNTIIDASAATLKTFTLKLAATSNQTITLKYKNHKSDGTVAAEVTKTSTSSAQSFTVGYGTTWTATLAAATGYTKGTLSASSGTVKAATTVSATAATAITPKITITKAGQAYNFSVTYTNTSGTSTTTGNRPSSVTIKYNTKVRFNANTGSSYCDLSIKQGSTYKTTIDSTNQWTSGALTANTTFTVTGIDNTPEGSGGEGSGGEGGA